MSDYVRWRAETDTILKDRYAIDLEDVGTEEDSLVAAWRAGESSTEYVERFALKYDLDPVSLYRAARA
ncbi:MAG: hypothetical protein ABL308_02595 [Oceanicaulis sp.]